MRFEKNLFLLFLGTLILNAGGSCTRKVDCKQADVYLKRWNDDYDIAQAPDNVRTYPDYKHSYTMDAYKVVNALNLGAMYQVADAEGEDARVKAEDARLVVDLFDHTGKRTTYYAGQFCLLTADNQWKHWIDDSFKRKFEELAR